MAGIDQLRLASPEKTAGKTDLEIVTAIANKSGKSPWDIGQALGVEVPNVSSSMLGSGYDAAIASWQAGMGAIGQLAGMDNADFIKRKNAEAAFHQSQAPGTTQFFGDEGVVGSGSTADWLAYNLGQSIPYIAEMMLGAVTGGLGAAGMGARAAATGLAKEMVAKQAATNAAKGIAEREAWELAGKQVAERVAATAGGGLASYPSAVGDILTNQIEEGGIDSMQALPALAGGIPYAAMNMLGGEAAAVRALTGGVGGGIKDVLKATGKTMLTEGATETGQEVINQLAGRMAVNPDATLTSGDALNRYAESFAAGAGLGLVTGGAVNAAGAVFNKPVDMSPDAVAQRKTQMDAALEAIQAGKATPDEAWGLAQEQQTAWKKEAEDAAKAEEDAFYAQIAQEEKDAIDRTKARAGLATALEKLKQEKLKTELQAKQLQRDVAATGTAEEPQTDWVQGMTGEGALLGSSLGEPTMAAPASPEQLVAVLRARGVKGGELIRAQQAAKNQREFFDSLAATGVDVGGLFDVANLPRRDPEVDTVGSADYLGALNRAASEDAMARLAAEQASAPRTAAAQRAEAFSRNRAIASERARRENVIAATNQAYDELEAQMAQEKEADAARAFSEMNTEVFPGMTGDMFGRTPEIANAEREPQALGDDSQWRGALNMLMVAARELKDAKAAAEDAAIDASIGKRGARARVKETQATVDIWQKLYDDLQAVTGFNPEGGFPKTNVAPVEARTAAAEAAADPARQIEAKTIGYTPEMFQLREGETRPRATIAGKAASGNMFKQPKTKETTRGTETAQAQQAESATPAVTEPAAAPATGAVNVSDAAKALAAKFNKRKTLTAEEAQRVLDEEKRNAEEVQGQAPTEEVTQPQFVHEQPVTFTATHESSSELQSLADYNPKMSATSTGNNGLYGDGAYVTTATRRKGDPGYGPTKNTVSVTLNKPFVVSSESVANLAQHMESIGIPVSGHVAFRLETGNPDGAMQALMRGNDARKGNAHNTVMTKILKNLGYDGVVVEKNGAVEEAVVFDNSPSRQKQEVTNAVQEQAADEGRVQRGARAEDEVQGEAVGEGNAEPKKPAKKGKTEEVALPPLSEMTLGELEAEVARLEDSISTVESDLELKKTNSRLAAARTRIDSGNYVKGEGRKKVSKLVRELDTREAVRAADTGRVDSDKANESSKPLASDKAMEDGSVQGDWAADDPSMRSGEYTWFGQERTDKWAKAALKTAKTGADLIKAVLANGSPVERAIARMINVVGVGKVKVGYADAVHTSADGKLRYYGHHNNGEVTIFAGGENARVILHELIHAVTVPQLLRARAALEGSKARTAALTTDPETRALVDAYERLTALMDETNAVLPQATQFNDVLEFVSEALTDPRLQNIMANTRSAQTVMAPSLWNRFVDGVRGVLRAVMRGVSDISATRMVDLDQSVFARVLDATADVMREGKYEPYAKLPEQKSSSSKLVNRDGTEYRVFEDPSVAQVEALLAKSKMRSLRGFINRRTNRLAFAWDAYDAGHYETAQQLGLAPEKNGAIDGYRNVYVERDMQGNLIVTNVSMEGVTTLDLTGNQGQYSASPIGSLPTPANGVTPLTYQTNGLLAEMEDHPLNYPFGSEKQRELAKQWGKKKMFNAGRLVRDALNHIHTMRGLGNLSEGFRYIQSLISRANNEKMNINNDFNIQIKKFLETMRRGSDAVKELTTQLIEVAAQRYSGNNIPDDIRTKISTWAHDHLSGKRRIYTLADQTKYPELLPELWKEILVSKEDFAKGIAIPNQPQRVIKFPEGMTKDDKDKAYAAYESAIRGMVSGSLQQLKAAEETAQRTLEDVRPLARNYTGKLLESMRKLRNLHNDTYKKYSSIDTKERRVRQMEADIDKLFADIELVLPGLIRGATPKSDALAIKLRETLGLTEAELDELLKPLRAEVEKLTGAAQISKAKAMTKDIVAGSNIAMLAESKALRTMQELLTSYVPFRRYGKYTMALKIVDENGNDIAGTITLFDGRKVNSSILDVRMSDDYLAMVALHKRESDLLSADNWKDGRITVEVTQRDEDGHLVTENDKPVTRTVEGRLMWTAPQRVKSFKTTPDYINAQEFLAQANLLGINISPADREKVIKATTAADASTRFKSLERENTIGYSTNFVRAISDHLGSVAAFIAIQKYKPEVDEALMDKALWEKPDNVKLRKEIDAKKAEWEAAKKGSGEGKAQIVKTLKEELDRMERNFQNANRLDTVDIQHHAKQLVDFVFDRNSGMEEDTSLTGKMRAAVTIMQLGGTLASPITNLSSIPLHAFSYLATYNEKRAYGGGFGGKAASDALVKSWKAMTPVLVELVKQVDPRREMFIPEELYFENEKKARANSSTKDEFDGEYGGYSARHWEFLRKAAAEGVLGAQRYNELLAQRKHSQFGPRASKFISHYMAPFAATEEFNRTVTGLAAFDLYYKQYVATGVTPEEAARKAYDAAVNTIYNTQGEYNLGNRPALLRSDLGALVFLYKTFIITTLELIRNLPPKGQAVFLGALLAFSGVGGVPFWEEMMIVLDTAAHKTGVGLGITKGNAEKAFTEFAEELGNAVGVKGMGEVATRGVLDVLLGTEIFGRAGVSVGVPMMGMLRPGAQFMEEVGKSFGAFGGAVNATEKAVGRVFQGDWEGAFREAPITLSKNVADAYTYAKYGNVMNKRGQVVVQDPSIQDIVARFLGFYPEELKWANDKVRREEYTRAFAKEMKAHFTEAYRKAAVRGDQGEMQEILQDVREHNANFRGTALELANFAESAKKAAKDAKLPLVERAKKTLPKAQQKDNLLEL